MPLDLLHLIHTKARSTWLVIHLEELDYLQSLVVLPRHLLSLRLT